jgi:uncharacterized membrane protein
VNNNTRSSDFRKSTFNKALTVILALAVLGSIGMLTYVIAVPKTGEKFSEFYILGLNGKAEGYPSDFILANNQVRGVNYGEFYDYTAQAGQVILGIVNHEQKPVTYSVAIRIDGQPVNIRYNGQNPERLKGIQLDHSQKWEGKIGFIPQHVGNNQKVDFFLYKDGSSEAVETLHLWVNVVAQ